jgi:F0F1-type ATP synthase assembly protein I
MPSDNNQLDPAPDNSSKPLVNKIQKLTNQSTLAFELPFTFVGAVAVGGLIGFYLDKWLHSGPWLMIVFGTFGFVAGIVEIARRLGPGKST